jgi:hypothetical protein
MTVVLLALVRRDAGHINVKGVGCPFRSSSARKSSPIGVRSPLGPKPNEGSDRWPQSVIDNGLGRHAPCHGQLRALKRPGATQASGGTVFLSGHQSGRGVGDEYLLTGLSALPARGWGNSEPCLERRSLC